LAEQRKSDEARTELLAANGIEELRFWNHQWRKNREGVLLEIWRAIHRRTGCVQVLRKVENQHYVPPDPARLVDMPAKPAMWQPPEPEE